MTSKNGASGPQRQARRFDPTDYSTYTLEALRELSAVELLQTLNDIPRHAPIRGDMDPYDARMVVLQAICLAFANVRRRNDERTLSRTAMFAYDDGASWLRPSVGLKRTFPPGLNSAAFEERSTDS
uniref:Small capsomere-interacting protein n=1 Tax=Anatid alphaherpesvirus 2 TaxID=3080522 RepID=A0AAU0K8G7_9ALPH